MPEAEIYRVIRQFRRDLLAREKQAASDLVHHYGEVWKEIRRELSALNEQYEQARSSGREPGPGWIYRFNRARAFQDQVLRELLAFSQYAERRVRDGQIDAIRLAEEQAERLVRLSLGRPREALLIHWNRIDHLAVQSALGLTQTESPLSRLFREISEDGAERAKAALVRGMILGKNPREVAPDLRRALGVPLRRALVISRTETLRAHREATRAAYQENSQIVSSWIWHSALDERTCASCWAMHGTVHSLDEVLTDHPNGRCVMIPKTRSWSSILTSMGASSVGIEETSLEVPRGSDLFRKLPYERQVQIVGENLARYLIFSKKSLSDLIQVHSSSLWGDTHEIRTPGDLKEVLTRAESSLVGIRGMTYLETVEAAKEIYQKLSTLLERDGLWNGLVTVSSDRRLHDRWGRVEFTGEIFLNRTATLESLLHELLHTFSIGLSPKVYRKFRDIEEGTVEGATRAFREMILGTSTPPRYRSYSEQVSMVEKYRSASGLSEKEFYKLLLNTPVSDRERVMAELARRRLE